MKKIILGCLGFVACAWSTFAVAVTGEYWEVSSQMEMPGMSFAMPAQMTRACLPKGWEGDPQRTQGNDSKCTFKDVQRSGNTVKYRGTCVNSRGDTMSMTGETTHDSNSFKTRMQMADGNQGQPMTMSSSGKRVGGSCDTEEMANKTQAQAREQKQQVEKMQKDALANACDISDPGKLLRSESYYAGTSPMCSNKKEYCQAVREKAQHDVSFFREIASQEKMRKQYASQGVKRTEEISVINICGLDMASLKKTICKNSVHRGPQDFLDENCSPAEAKEYREFVRKQQDCEGRGYTSGEKMKACMSGMVAKEDESCEGRGYTSPEQREACRNLAKCGSDICGSTGDTVRKDDSRQKESGLGGINSGTVLEGAKKLKGLFGF